MTKRGEVGNNRVAKKGKEKGKKQRVKMIIEDYDVVVTYIENLEHYRDIKGGGMNGFPQVMGEEMKKRFVRYEKMYKDAQRWKDSTGKHPNIVPCGEESVGVPLDVDMEYVSKDSQIPLGSNEDTMDEYIVLGSGESDAEEVHVTRVTIGMEDNFVAKDHAEETFINLVDAEYGKDETFGDEEGEHFEHASGGGSEINEPIRLQKEIP
ncbi:hypothetical protein R1flu_023387 [Riccia fluitans]|uniref:Uncharacterized protein n=1 Tax=Riccia fluitans TaxID=41844 RepID=A0ABD1XSE6_9MARC